MKKYVLWLLVAMMFIAAVTAGCGGSSDAPDTEQTESLNEDTDSYDPNGENRGTSDKVKDLSDLKRSYTAQNEETLTGTLGANVCISVADGATVTLRDVTIEGKNWVRCSWAGLSCQGDATLIIEGTNSVKGFHQDYPAIHVPVGKTLTIKGSGSLDTSSNGKGAGIGGGSLKSCGNIVIDGGTITATGGEKAAGIGGGYSSNCGDITISGGKVKAISGSSAPYSIGAGKDGSCGIVTIGGVVTDPITQSKYECSPVDLSKVNSDYTARNGDILMGSLGRQVSIVVADGATITLRGANIVGQNFAGTPWAGLTCSGDATLILEGNNYVKSFYRNYSAIYVPEDHTLTIKGSGALTADASVSYSAGIGSGMEATCGDIVIEGGIINAIGGFWSAGIGGGYYGKCGKITIKDTVTKVKATKGEYAPYSIGAGSEGSCGEVTIGDDIGQRSEPTCTYPPDMQ